MRKRESLDERERAFRSESGRFSLLPSLMRILSLFVFQSFASSCRIFYNTSNIHRHKYKRSPAPTHLFLSSMFPPCRACSSRLLQIPKVEKAVGVGSIIANHFGRPHAAACRHVYLQTSEEHASSTLASIISPSCLEDDDGHGECPCGRAIDYLAAAR